jgi:hypothetical protein
VLSLEELADLRLLLATKSSCHRSWT